MATSFGHNGHHQAISLKLKKKATWYIQCTTVSLYGIPFPFMSIFINSYKIINGLKMCHLQCDVSMFCYGCCEYI